jgi:hypothetical protein
MRFNVKAAKRTKILQSALIIVSLAGIRSAHAAACLGATSSGPEFQSFEVDATPSAGNPAVDGAVGLSNTLMTAYTDLAAVVRFHDNGMVDARNDDFSVTTTVAINHLRLQGGVKEVRVWNRALAATEVAALYTGTVPTSGLVAEYMLEGDVVPDTAGAHTATSYGSHCVPQQ